MFDILTPLSRHTHSLLKHFQHSEKIPYPVMVVAIQYQVVLKSQVILESSYPTRFLPGRGSEPLKDRSPVLGAN